LGTNSEIVLGSKKQEKRVVLTAGENSEDTRNYI
jgi:hypothetical protein